MRDNWSTGKITKYTGHWALDMHQGGRLIQPRAGHDARGREMWLVQGPAARCEDLSMAGDWAVVKEGNAEYLSILAKSCRKCQHYRKGAYCAFLVQKRRGQAKPVDMLALLQRLAKSIG